MGTFLEGSLSIFVKMVTVEEKQETCHCNILTLAQSSPPLSPAWMPFRGGKQRPQPGARIFPLWWWLSLFPKELPPLPPGPQPQEAIDAIQRWQTEGSAWCQNISLFMVALPLLNEPPHPHPPPGPQAQEVADASFGNRQMATHPCLCVTEAGTLLDR